MSNLLWRIIYSHSCFWSHYRLRLALLFKDQSESRLSLLQVFRTGENRFVTGFSDWKRASKYYGSHESSSNHSISIKIFLQRSTKIDRIDQQSLEVFKSGFKYTLFIISNIFISNTRGWTLDQNVQKASFFCFVEIIRLIVMKMIMEK